MEIEKYIPKNVIETLKKKGFSEDMISSEVEKTVTQGKKLFPEDYDSYVRNRLKAKFNGFINSDSVAYTGVILGKKSIEDENLRLRRMAKMKAGTVYAHPKSGEKFEAKEGYVPWGMNIGEPIPDEPSWKQDILVAFQIKNGLEIRTVTLNGNWVKDETINSAQVGDKIVISGPSDLMDKKTINVSSYEVDSKIEDEKFKKIINENLKDYKLTIRDILDENFDSNQLAVINGNISEFTPRGDSTLVKFTDDTAEWGEENSVISVYMNNPNFVEDAINVLFIGEVFKNKEGNVGFNVFHTIVPEEFKPVETTNNDAEKIADETFKEESEELEDNIVEESKEETDEEVEDLL